MRIFMDDRIIVKIFYTHIFRIFVIAIIAFVSSLSDAHATTGDEKKPNKGEETAKKAKVPIDLKAIPIGVEEAIISSNESVAKMPTYYSPSYIEQEQNSNGEDQNAVLSFNLIHYIFQRFKFSEEVY